MLIFSVSFQVRRMIPEGNPKAKPASLTLDSSLVVMAERKMLSCVLLLLIITMYYQNSIIKLIIKVVLWEVDGAAQPYTALWRCVIRGRSHDTRWREMTEHLGGDTCLTLLV